MEHINDPDIGLFYNAVEGSSIALIVHEVDSDKEEEFVKWQHDITELASTFPGYQRTLLFQPRSDAHDEWITSVHFESAEALDKWLESPERKKWMEEHQAPFSGVVVKKTKMGLERWFSNEEAPPPDWRMVMAVTLALYPTMIILTQLINPDLPAMSLGAGMLIGNFFGVAALQWVGMPIVNKFLGWWLAPASAIGWGKSFLGLGIIIACLYLFYLLYLYLAPFTPPSA